MARMRSDVCPTPGASPAAFIRRPASFASVTPSSLSGTSCQPVNRFSRFQVLWPWRKRTSVPNRLPMTVHPRGHIHDLGEFVRVETRPANQTAIAQRQLDVCLDVARVDATSVEDPHLFGRARADHLADRSPDQPHRLVRVLRVGALARTDGPHGLVCNYKTGGIVGRTV